MKNDLRPVAAPLHSLHVRPDHVVEGIAEMFNVPTGDASLYFAGESTGNRHCL